MTISNYLENKILDKVLRDTNFEVDTVYVSLHTADPGETGTSEVTNSGGSTYARQLLTSDAASGGQSVSSAAIEFTNMPATTVTHACLWDAVSAGNCLWIGPLTQSRTLQLGDIYRIPLAQLTVTLD